MSYVIDIRRQLHMYPEIGFELPRTLELVRGELTKMGVPFTEKYGKSGIVATINEEKSDFTIGVRADMDALPIEEKVDVEFKSKIKGQMHACGHDAHTAILLDTARRLNEMKEDIKCCVKLIFQPAEEYPPSGAKLMADDGVMDDIDCIIALHVDPAFECGEIGISPGPMNATSNGFHLDFYGKAAHAAEQECGVDAIAMAFKAYGAIELMMAKELPATACRVFNCGSINGGVTNNVICDHVSMNCTVRAWDEKTEEHIMKRINDIITAVASESGGKATFTQDKYYPIVYNDEKITDLILKSARKIVGEEKIHPLQRELAGEDLSYFTRLKPGATFRLGVRNAEQDCVYAFHQDKFKIDESALEIGTEMYVNFVVENMDGIR